MNRKDNLIIRIGKKNNIEIAVKTSKAVFINIACHHLFFAEHILRFQMDVGSISDIVHTGNHHYFGFKKLLFLHCPIHWQSRKRRKGAYQKPHPDFLTVCNTLLYFSYLFMIIFLILIIQFLIALHDNTSPFPASYDNLIDKPFGVNNFLVIPRNNAVNFSQENFLQNFADLCPLFNAKP